MPPDAQLQVDGANDPPLKRKTLSGLKPHPRQPAAITVEHRPKTHAQPQPNRAPVLKQGTGTADAQRTKDFIDLTGDDSDSSSEDAEIQRRKQLERFGQSSSNGSSLKAKAELSQPRKPQTKFITPASLHTQSIAKSPNVRLVNITSDEPPLKRKRGRPPGFHPPVEPEKKRPRGRPRKSLDAAEDIEASPLGAIHNVGRPLNTSLSDNWRPKGELNASTTVKWMQRHARHPLVKQLNTLSPPASIVNEVDRDGPPQDFVVIKEYEYTAGTTPLDPNARYGCSCRNCETQSCDCLADCANGEDGEPLGFPYATSGERKGCLLDKYLDHRHVIYECNELCDCGSKCKNKVVKRGRRVPLEIFKTADRGWGLRCYEDLRAGEFVDVYLGEIITDAEAKRREGIAAKNSYLFTLDKFQRPGGDSSMLYVVDGERRGSVARFINHCCDPNLRVFAVSFDRGDPRVYQLAFFAAEYIPAGTELTFDYLDRDSEEYEDEDGNPILSQGEKSGYQECRCGAPDCRKWLWQ